MITDARRGDLGRLFDATGFEIDDVITADIETGEVLCFVRDTDGVIQIAPNGIEGLKALDRYKAPLIFEPTAAGWIALGQRHAGST